MNSYAVFSFPAYGVCAFYLRKDGIRENPPCLLQQRLSLLGMIHPPKRGVFAPPERHPILTVIIYRIFCFVTCVARHFPKAATAATAGKTVTAVPGIGSVLFRLCGQALFICGASF